MKAVRTEARLTQADMAARLEIADRTYKFYELEKREIPFSTAVRFTELFNLNLTWLATGEGPRGSISEPDLTVAVVRAVFDALGEKMYSLPPELLAKQIAYVRDQSLKSGDNPSLVAATLISLLPD